jgi:multiple antibiotic resistance protein
MLEAAKNLFLIVSALFPIVDPLGGSPIFLALTRDYGSPGRQALSRRIALNSFFLLVGSYLVGTHILAFFGISIPVVQVGGGLIVISTGWAMLKQPAGDDEHKVTRRRNVQEPDPLRHAFYPFTLPLTVGPGSISIAITLGANAHHHGWDPMAVGVAVVGSALIALSIWICYGSSEQLARILGATAMTVIMQLASFLLVCIGVQILWNGASALLTSVHFNLAGH